MLLTYLKISLRHLHHYKLTSGLNILGLALGLTCTLFIFLFVKAELNYDRQFPKAERIFRITDQGLGDKARHWAATPPVLGEALQQYMPQVEAVGRMHYAGTKVLEYASSSGVRRSFEEKEGYYADASIAEIFDLTFLKGNSAFALKEPNTIVLTEKTAQKYFGTENPVGKILVGAYDKQPLRVAGVIQNLPATTHLQFDYLISMATKYAHDGGGMNNKTWNGFYTYALLKEGKSAKEVEKRMADFTASFYAAPGLTREEILSSGIFRLQPITDIHLYSKLEKEMGANGDVTYVYIFGTAAILILLIACINFINIATVQAFKRIKEVGVRKVLGAPRQQLISQFLVESLLITFLAAVLVVFLINLVLPFYNYLINNVLSVEDIFISENIAGMLLLVLVVGLCTGLYPALFVSGFKPINALKGLKNPGAEVTLLRQGLIVFQFVISVFMIVSTMVIYRQMEYFQNKNLGFEQDQVVAVKLYGESKNRILKNSSGFINQLTKNSAISGVSVVSNLPGERLGLYSFSVKGDTEETPNLRYMWADEGLLPTLNITLAAGNNFRRLTTDTATAFILNEAAATLLQIKEPIGKIATSGKSSLSGPIVGIVKDFNFASLHTEVEPLIIQYEPGDTKYLLVKLQGGQVAETLQYLKSSLEAYVPGNLFIYSFLNDNINKLYESEKRMSDIFKVFAGFTLFISCLGLFGLSAYAAELRTKEIGIRKVLGATEQNIVMLLSKDFVKLVLIAILIASPIAWYFMDSWLEDFAYRINISWWIFALAGLAAVAIALITVCFHAIKAALRNPVRNLRTE